MLVFNPLNVQLNPICHLLALLGAHHILHVSRIRVKVVLHFKIRECPHGEMSRDGLAKFLRRFGEEHYIYRQGKKKKLPVPPPQIDIICIQTLLTSTVKRLSALYQSEGRAVCTSLPVWHVTHSRLLAELLCPPWRHWPPCRPHARLSGYKERQHPNLRQVIIPFNLTKQKIKKKERKELLPPLLPLSLHKKSLWSKCMPKTQLPWQPALINAPFPTVSP